MTAIQTTKQFDWLSELEKTTFKSLVTTFGLDFLLVQDKHGGNVDTIHNVRHGVWATDKEKSIYDNKESYKITKTDANGSIILNAQGKEVKVDKYHSDTRFRAQAKSDGQKRLDGELFDSYRNTQAKTSEKTQLDHIISSSEIHADAGRVLAGLDGVELSLADSNLASTHAYINNKKSNMTMKDFVQEIPSMIEAKQKSVQNNKNKLATMPSDTPEQRHKIRKLQDEIKKEESHIKTLQSCDKEAMLSADKKARQEYNQKINEAYYKSSKFLTATGKQSAIMGVKMGFRQALGLVLAEIWFELKVALPTILKKCQQNFDFKTFIDDVGNALKNIFQRIELRFKDLLASFKDGFLGGVLASISTTIINIFFTTSKLIGKLIRESWQNLVQVAKLMFFNPDNLSNGQLFKEITRIILASIATIVGVVVNQHLATLFTFPLGSELAAFLSALLTGVLMIGCAYFIDYSQLMQKVWQFLDNLKDKYGSVLKHLQKANAELDAYLLELTKLEFNLSPQELQSFSDSLAICADEYQKSVVIQKEIERRNITLPFEMGNDNSTMQWLNSLTPKP